MSVEYSASEYSEVGTSDIFDLMSECGDCKLESMTLVQLTQLRSRLNSNVSHVEKCALEREQQEANERLQQNQEICQSCKLIQDPRQRKVAEIRQLHLQILNNKSADLMCTPGIFSRLEEMACKGLLDSVVAGGNRCPKCRQTNDISAMNKLITSEILDILKQELASTQPDCCLSRACSKCLHFVISSLGNAEEFQLSAESNHEGNGYQMVSEFNKLKQQFAMLNANMEAKTAEMLNNNMSPLSLKLDLLYEQLKSLNTPQQIEMKPMNELNVKLDLLSEQLKGLNKSQTIEIKNISPLNELNVKLDLLSKQLKNNSPSLEISNCNAINSNNNEIKNYIEFFGIPKKLYAFYGDESWVSPRLMLRNWEEYLKRSQIPKEDWCQTVCNKLEYREARKWRDSENMSEKTWEQFSEMFVDCFDKKMVEEVTKYINWYHSVYQVQNRLFNDCLKQVLYACLRGLGDDIELMKSIFNTNVFGDNTCTTFIQMYCRLNQNMTRSDDDSRKLYQCLRTITDYLRFDGAF